MIIDRYIRRAILLGSLVVLFMLVVLMTILTFITQVDDKPVMDAFIQVSLFIPQLMTEMFSPAVLIGSLIGLGGLAANSELMVMRAAGVSVKRLAWAVVKAGLILAVLSMVVGEFLRPWAETIIKDQKLSSVYRSRSNAAWLIDGNTMVRLQSAVDEKFQGVTAYTLSPEGTRLNAKVVADSAQYDDRSRQWQLSDYHHTEFLDEGSVDVRRDTQGKTLQWMVNIEPDLPSLLEIQPYSMSALGLSRYIGYLEKNRLDTHRYRLAFWNKLVAPVAVIMMALMALPIAFGSLRSGGMGQRAAVGLMTGAAYYLANRIFVHSGQVFNFDAMVAAWLPTGVLILVTAILFSRLR